MLTPSAQKFHACNILNLDSTVHKWISIFRINNNILCVLSIFTIFASDALQVKNI